MKSIEQSHGGEDLNLHAFSVIRAGEILKLVEWKAREQKKSIGLNPAALPLLTLKDKFDSTLSHRQGLQNSTIDDKDLYRATTLLADLVTSVAADQSYTARQLSNPYEYGQKLTPGELWITQIKNAGFRINLIDSKGAEITNVLAMDIERGSFVAFRNGKAISRGYTQSWKEIAENHGIPFQGKYPSTVPEVVDFYQKLAESKNAVSNSQYVVLHAKNADGYEQVGLITTSKVSSVVDLDTFIHDGRHSRLMEISDLVSHLPQQLKVAKLDAKRMRIVIDAVERARSISDFANLNELASLLEILMKIDEFKHMSAGAQAYILTTWHNAIWTGTGDRGMRNPLKSGFNGRTIA